MIFADLLRHSLNNVLKKILTDGYMRSDFLAINSKKFNTWIAALTLHERTFNIRHAHMVEKTENWIRVLIEMLY